MPTNNFKLFDENKVNMMTDNDYAINQQRLNGVQSGVASSQLQNKTLYQTALMCYALAQLMAANGYDANDANAVSAFVNNLSSSVLQKVVDKATAEDVKNKKDNKWIPASMYSENLDTIGETYLKLSGGQMTGSLLLAGDPEEDEEAVTKSYVDERSKIYVGSYTGNGNVSEGATVSISCPLIPQIVFIFPYTTLPFPLTAVNQKFYYCLLTNDIDHAPPNGKFGIWFNGLEYVPVRADGSSPSYSVDAGSRVHFEQMVGGLKWTLERAEDTSISFKAPNPEFIYNELNHVYTFVAIG